MTGTRNKSKLLKNALVIVLAAVIFVAMFPITSSAASTKKCYTSALYKTNDSIKPSAFKKVSGSTVAKGKLTASKVKKLVTAAGVGGHMRTKADAHSMIISNVTSDGFTVIQCNGSNNKNYKGYYKCRIGYSNYTWSSYAKSTYGKRGLEYIKVKK